MRKNRLTSVIFPAFLKSLVGSIVALLILELIFRLFVPAPIDLLQLNEFVESERGKFAQYDELLGWVGKPNINDDFQWMDTSHKVIQNSYGFRGTDHAQGPSDRRRILVLGDSFVWGFGVENEEIFTSLMGNSGDGKTEVINCGVSGYGNDQDYLYWQKHGHLWQPDDVVLVITAYTDIVDNLFAKRYGYAKPRFVKSKADSSGGQSVFELANVPVPRLGDFDDANLVKSNIAIAKGLPWGLGNLYLAKMLVNALATNDSYRKKMENDGLIPRRLPGYDWEYPLYENPPSRQARQGWDLMFGLVKMLEADVNAHGAKLTVAIVPSIIQVYPELWGKFSAGRKGGNHSSTLDRENPNRTITNWCQANGIEVVDLLPALREAGEKNSFLYFPYNLHWTAAGHQVVADEIFSAVGIE